ncbi:CENP-S protein domain-containing protein [Phthorimaea operculella]|nr:CENP-S protein domain-containing protein [Phthorimaea operculella]
MAAFDKLSGPQKIRAALHRDVWAISSETCHFLGLEISKPAMEVIAELVYKKLSVYGTDLEAFAKHAKRSTINSEDVKLIARRNPSLVTHLNSIVPASTPAPQKRRKTGGKPQETPAKNKEDVNKNKEDNNKGVEDVNRNKEDTINKPNEPISTDKTKAIILEDTVRMDDDFLENMIVDEIDLTFDSVKSEEMSIAPRAPVDHDAAKKLVTTKHNYRRTEQEVESTNSKENDEYITLKLI